MTILTRKKTRRVQADALPIDDRLTNMLSTAAAEKIAARFKRPVPVPDMSRDALFLQQGQYEATKVIFEAAGLGHLVE